MHTASLPGPTVNGVTVVFEAGAADSRSSWALVQLRVAAFARTVVYDRSGLGRSAPNPAERTLDRMADDLNDLLDASPPGPLILVGHSAGGPIVRLAASRRPDRIAGLVLVDPTDELVGILFSRAFRLGERAVLQFNRVLARLGLLRRLYQWQLDAMPAPDVRTELGEEGFTPGVVRTHAAQARTFLNELATWRQRPPDLGEIPVTVISGTRPGDGLSSRARAQTNTAHAARAAVSPRGRHVLAETSSHYVPFTDPELIAAEIHRLTGAP
ncbi:alpha/beta fold hydrolase [Microbacterium sp.]|uniref:alpha/beta fold hydrolase n=1 Tax=Microbacterium sp. TaxID=51671 RepID=UPI003F9A8294